MLLTLERISELLELDVSNLDLEDRALLLGTLQEEVNEKGEQYLSENKYLLKDSFDYVRNL